MTKTKRLITFFYILGFGFGVIYVNSYSQASGETLNVARIPTAHWDFNEGSGGTTTSSGENSINATLSNGAEWESTNLPFTEPDGAGVKFDGVNDAVKVTSETDLGALNVDQHLTIAAWIYPEEQDGAGIILNKEGEYEIAVYPDGTLRWAIANTDPGWRWVNTEAVVPTNQWSHVAFVYSDFLNTATTYVNGIEVDRRTASGSIGDIDKNLNEFWIGGRQALGDHFQGIIDEVYVHDYFLTNHEITELAAVEVASCGPIQVRAANNHMSEMVGYQQPDKPILHHEPGYQAHEPEEAKSIIRSTDQTGRMVEAEGTLYDDPLQGNRNLVHLDNLVVARVDDDVVKVDANRLSQQIESGENKGNFAITAPENLVGSEDPAGGFVDGKTFDLAAGDINGDDQDEQILAFQSNGSSPFILKVTGYPGSSGYLSSEPVAMNHAGEIYLFARGYDDALWIAIDKGPILSWQRCDGTLASAPAVAEVDSDTLIITVLGTDGQLWERSFSTSSSPDWSQLPAGPIAFDSTPAVVAHSDGSRDVFVRGRDNAVYTNHFDGENWKTWISLGGYVADGGIGAIATSNGQMVLLVRGFDNHLWYRTFDKTWDPNWTFAAASDFELASAVTTIPTGENSFDAFVRGDDNSLRKLSFNNGVPSSWETVPVSAAVGSRVAVAKQNGAVKYYASSSEDGSLLSSIANNDWSALTISPPDAVVYITGLYPVNASSVVKVVTGHFSGNGREQIVMVYINNSHRLAVHMYEADGGFKLREVASFDRLTKGINNRQIFDIDSGDFDGDGTDELAIMASGDGQLGSPLGADRTFNFANSYIIDFDEETKQLSEASIREFNSRFDTSVHYLASVSIATGNFSGGSKEDIAIAYTTHQTNWTPSGRTFTGILSLDESDFTQNRSLIGAAITGNRSYMRHAVLDVGDLLKGPEGETRRDEIVLAASNGTNGNVPLRVYKIEGDRHDYVLSGEAIQTSDYGADNKKFELTVGDFDRDFADEFVFARWNGGLGTHELIPFKFVDGILQNYPKRAYRPTILSNEHLAMVAGDFTGQSLRVGVPDYRLQHNVGTVVAIINAPPSHADTVNGQQISIARDGNGSAVASYSTNSTQTAEISVQSNRSMGYDTLTETTTGNPEGTHVTASLEKSYGNDFGLGRESLNEQSIKTEISAVTEDRVIYKGDSYQIWEYPLYGDDSDIPINYISIVFPVPNSNAGQLNNRIGRACTPWYLPTHQIGNVWSYPTLGDTSTFRGYRSSGNMLDLPTFDVADGTTSWSIEMGEVNSAFHSSAVRTSVTAGLEAQIGGDEIDVGFDTPFGSIGGSITTPSIKGSLDGHYSSEDLSTSKITSRTDLQIGSLYQGIANTTDNFTVRSFLYRADGGYIVLDHTASIDENSGIWLNYDKPDPTFRRPWALDALCGPDKVDYSPEITFEPEYASPGETVKITAKVHNYSNEVANNVKVSFYAGDPETGGQLIGSKTVSTLTRQAGPQTISMDWTAAGAGEVRIYAVVDPDNTIAEVHDEVSNTNNNRAFNTIRLAASDFVDMGLPQAYYPLEFGTTTAGSRSLAADELTYSAFIAVKELSETIQFELTAVDPQQNPPAGLRFVDKPFDLRAYSAGDILPIDLTPEDGDAPSVIKVGYGAAVNDEQIVLRRLVNNEWGDAGCSGRPVEQLKDENLFVVPVCSTGQYALFTTDESGPAIVNVATTSVNVDESDLSATVTIQLSKPAVGNEAIDYMTVDGTAVAGSDYVDKSGTLNFKAGETSKAVQISIVNDASTEPTEQFGVVFENGVNLTLGTNTLSTVAIIDDDDSAPPQEETLRIYLPLITR